MPEETPVLRAAETAAVEAYEAHACGCRTVPCRECYDLSGHVIRAQLPSLSPRAVRDVAKAYAVMREEAKLP